MHPSALIPSTTALATLTPRRTGTGDIGRSKCSHAQSVATGGTEKVYLYNNKASLGAESAEGIRDIATTIT